MLHCATGSKGQDVEVDGDREGGGGGGGGGARSGGESSLQQDLHNQKVGNIFLI